MNHNKLVKIVSNELKSRGYVVENEKLLPLGKGSVDISCKNKGKYLFHAEVKEMPASIKKKKVSKQLNLYKKYFGNEPDYILISPDAFGEVIFQDLSGKFRGSLDNYISFLNH